MKTIIASSQPYYIELGANYTKPFTFTAKMSDHNSEEPLNISLIDKEGNIVDVLQGRKNARTGSNTFNVAGTTENLLISLYECLRLNPNFSDVHLSFTRRTQTLDGVAGYISQNVRNIYYEFPGRQNYLYFTGSFQTTRAIYDTRISLNFEVDNWHFSQTKIASDDNIKFNVASPFEMMNFRYPLDVKVNATTMVNGKGSVLHIAENEFTVLPTTLSIFEKVDYSQYLHIAGSPLQTDFLTDLRERNYAYDEICAVSFLSETPVTLTAKYYTTSGRMFFEKDLRDFSEVHSNRYDFFYNLDIREVERTTANTCGYVLVDAYDEAGAIISRNPLKYNVIPRCSLNNEIFFINRLGGVDSYNNWKITEELSKIGELETGFKNIMEDQRNITHTAEYEFVHHKSQDASITLQTYRITREEALWLRQLQKSKTAFQLYETFQGDETKWQTIIIENFDIKIGSTDNEYQLSLTYRDYDNQVRF